MPKGPNGEKRRIPVKPYSYQPSKAELEKDVSVDATPEALAECLGRTVAVVEKDSEPS